MNALEVFCLQVFNENLLFWLNLQELEQEAHEFCWPLIAEDTPDILESNGLVDETLRCGRISATHGKVGWRTSQRKTMFLPVVGFIDAIPYYSLD